MEKDNVINLNLEVGDKTKRQLGVIKEVTINSTKERIRDRKAQTVALGFGIAHGILSGKVSIGVRTGLAIFCGTTAANVLFDVINSVDEIDNA